MSKLFRMLNEAQDMDAKVFRISSQLNESLNAPEPEIAAHEVFATPEPDIASWLEDEGLVLSIPEAYERKDLDVFADSWLERMAQLQTKMDENVDVASRRAAMIRDWVENTNAALQRRYDFMERTLLALAHAYPYPGKSKTRDLAFGTIKLRTVPAKLEVIDKDAVLAYAKEIVPDAVEDVPTLRKAKLNEHWESTGVVPVGCEEVKEETRAYVTVKAGK